MPQKLIWRLVFLGALAIAGIIFLQSFWVFKAWNLQDEDFNYKVKLALRHVAERISVYNDTNLPKQGLIQRGSSNYYSVNINSSIDANILEDYLIQEFEKVSLYTDFEYAVFDCASDELLYGNYCQLSDDQSAYTQSEDLPKFNDLIYYFVVKFPSRESYLLNNMRQSILFSLIALLAILFFIYAIRLIIKQKQLTEQQKDFINNMTHEFKTPISSIKIASEVLIQNDDIKANNRLSQYAHIIRDQNDRLNNQVEKVLNIARVEKNHFELNREDINLHTTLEEIIAQEAIKFKDSKTRIETNFSASDSIVNVDQLHFINVVSNIFDNAVKYKKSGPAVIKVTTHSEKSQLIIRIKDNGIGISEEDQKSIFSKFYRVHTGNVHNVKGFGLGLYYVKNIADIHGWELNLDSELGKGTTISIGINKN